MKFSFIILLTTLFSVNKAEAFLKICNKSNEQVFVAVGYKDGDSWIAEGWWVVLPFECENVINGNLPGRYYYLRAEGVNGGVWGGDYNFCTTSEKFKLADSEDCVSSQIDREGFYSIDTGSNFDWTTNLLPR